MGIVLIQNKYIFFLERWPSLDMCFQIIFSCPELCPSHIKALAESLTEVCQPCAPAWDLPWRVPARHSSRGSWVASRPLPTMLCVTSRHPWDSLSRAFWASAKFSSSVSPKHLAAPGFFLYFAHTVLLLEWQGKGFPLPLQLDPSQKPPPLRRFAILSWLGVKTLRFNQLQFTSYN